VGMQVERRLGRAGRGREQPRGLVALAHRFHCSWSATHSFTLSQALGCVLFTLAFYETPFDGTDLQILNVRYRVPERHPYSSRLTSMFGPASSTLRTSLHPFLFPLLFLRAAMAFQSLAVACPSLLPSVVNLPTPPSLLMRYPLQS